MSFGPDLQVSFGPTSVPETVPKIAHRRPWGQDRE